MIVKKLDGFIGPCLIALISACGQTGVRDIRLVQDRNLPRPARIAVYDFAVSEQEVKEYQGIMRQQPSIKDAATREKILAQEVKDALAAELVGQLKPLGFVVERIARGAAVAPNDLVIDGQFMTVDEGNPLNRLVVGFGSGASLVRARVQLFQAPDQRLLMEFTTQSDSGKMPGAAPTLGVGAAAQGGVTAGMAASNAAVSGVRSYNSEVARMAASSGEQAARYLSEFFAKQGWIKAEQVRKARMIVY